LDKGEEFVKELKSLERRLSEVSRGGSQSDFERLKSDLRELVLKLVESDLPDPVKDAIGERADALDRKIQDLERRVSAVESI